MGLSNRMRSVNSVRSLSRAVRTVCDNGATVITQQTNHAVAAVGLVSSGGSRAETAPGQASVNRSITLSNIPAVAGVNVSSVLHRERTGFFGVSLPDKAADVAASF